MPKRPTEGPRAALARTVRLVAALLTGQPLDAKKAAQVLGVQEPAALQQMKALAALPGVTMDDGSGRKVWRYASEPATWGLPSVIAACFGSSLAPLFEGSAYGEHLDKLRSQLIEGTPRRGLFKNIDRKFWFLCQGGDLGISKDGSLLDEVIDALLHENRIRMTYEGFGGDRKEVSIAPLSIALYQHQLYLLGRQSDGSLHPYRLARVRSLEAEGRFTYPSRADFDPSAVFAQSLGIWIRAADTEEVEVRLDAKWATYAKTHRWHPSQKVVSEGTDVRVIIRCRICPEVEQWILSFGEAAEVIRPQTLRESIARRAMRLAARYSARTAVT